MSYPQYNCNRSRRIENEPSTVQKMKETYWTTKQVVMKKLGKKEDENLISSDAQLDAKLEVFKAVQKSCSNLQRCIELYQDRLCMLSHEENSMGRFLKSASQADKTRAGEIMNAVGKAQGISAQQRLALRTPLMRLYSEVDTFRNRAIEDTLSTVNRMEQSRTEYRGALLWMKDGSNNLDPDTTKQLMKFRKVQSQVKKTKARFDQLKLDSMQKIDLLVASRCNMFSQSLAVYQASLLDFWTKTSESMAGVAEAFKGYQYFEFNLLKILDEPVKELAKQTSGLSIEDGKDSATGNDENGDETTNKQITTDNGLIDFNQTEPSKDEDNDFLSFGSKEFQKFDPNNSGDDQLLGTMIDLTAQPISEIDHFLGNIKTTEEGFSTEWQSVFGGEPISPLKSPLVAAACEDDSLDLDLPPPLPGSDGAQASSSASSASSAPASASGTLGPAPLAPLHSVLTPSSLMDDFTAILSSNNAPIGAFNSNNKMMFAGDMKQPENIPLKHRDLKKPETDKSDWFKLFADLDPLANPDAIGKTDCEINEL